MGGLPKGLYIVNGKKVILKLNFSIFLPVSAKSYIFAAIIGVKTCR